MAIAEDKSLDLTRVISQLRNELTNIDHAIRALEKIASAETAEAPVRAKQGVRRKANGSAMSAGVNSM